ncbi:MAG: VOC family protein [Ignavibacteriae bacterium]|nr:VOC family protein [Ignavibacteriota bacterium]
MQKITPFLWFDKQAEEAVNLYTSVFKNSKIGTVVRYDESGAKASGMPVGTVMTASFQLDGHEFIALNGGPVFNFTPAISFVVYCNSQDEIDYFWEKLSAGGRTDQCGWLQDKFGISWQIVPTELPKLLGNGDGAKSQNVMSALLKMTKIDINALRKAYNS